MVEMQETYVVLKTNLGQLKGQALISKDFNKSYYAFRGIPYAKPPIGNLRFKAPQPYGGWEGVREALKDGNCSVQPASSTLEPKLEPNKVTLGSEDCLYLNVYMNKMPDNSTPKKPVMFFIHGGGFVGGSGRFDHWGPDFTMIEDVVLVTINYRCGALGFLSLESEEAPGNAGLKDQNLALQWVKSNIHSFGGDSNNVTIFGVSAGAASTHYHLLSQASKGLFHKAIIQSGNAICAWALQVKPREMAVRLAKVLGCSAEINSEILQFLQAATAEDILTASHKIHLDLKEVMETFGLIFTPCVEVAGASPFLTDTPENLMKTGQFNKVPVIIGCSENEGSVAASFPVMDDKKFEVLKKTPELLVPRSWKLKMKNSQLKEAGEHIWNFYLKDKTLPWGGEQTRNLQIFLNDVFFDHGKERTRKYLLAMSPFPVFSYLFTNHTRCECGIINKLPTKKDSISTPAPIRKETCHGADVGFLAVVRNLPQVDLTLDERKAIERHIKAWCTFAAKGDPSCEELGEHWEKDSWINPCFMEIGTTWTMKKGIPFSERVEFWKTLAAKYNTVDS